MSDHVHDWQPIEGECAKYACTCGATGYRARGGIREHKEKPQLARKWTAMDRTRGGGRVGRDPLNDYEPWGGEPE